MVGTCWSDDTTADRRATRRCSAGWPALAGQERALLAAIGERHRRPGRPARAPEAPTTSRWTDHERDALCGLGRRLGTVVEQLEGRRRDRHLVDELRELDQYRRDLVASITHDLKTPLTAIALNAELLESDRRLAEAGSHPVAAIRRSAERLSNLVDDLLALARAEEGSTAVRRTTSDLGRSCVRDACRHAEVEAQQRGVRFVLDLPESCGSPVDGDALARVYVNVVDNAVKFSLPDGEVRISLTTVGRRGRVHVRRRRHRDLPRRTRRRSSTCPARSRDPRARACPGAGWGWPSPSGSSRASGAASTWSPPRAGLDLHRPHPRGVPRPDATLGSGQRRPTWATSRPAKLSAGMPRVTRFEAGVEGEHDQHDRDDADQQPLERQRVAVAGGAVEVPDPAAQRVGHHGADDTGHGGPRIVPTSPSWCESAVAVAAATAPATTVG